MKYTRKLLAVFGKNGEEVMSARKKFNLYRVSCRTSEFNYLVAAPDCRSALDRVTASNKAVLFFEDYHKVNPKEPHFMMLEDDVPPSKED